MTIKRLFELIDQLYAATDYQCVSKVCKDFCEIAEFDYFIYAARIPTSLITPHYIIISGYPEEWREHYVESDYIRIDPTVTHCFNNVTPIYWENIVNTTCKHDQAADRLFCEANEIGLANGASFPIHCIHGETAMFSIATKITANKSRHHVLESIANSHMFASYVHEAVVRIPDNGLLARINSQLTNREKECLLWTTEGKTSWEISQILNIAERTVVFHINNAIKKLNVCNKHHAVARAISLGHITPLI